MLRSCGSRRRSSVRRTLLPLLPLREKYWPQNFSNINVSAHLYCRYQKRNFLLTLALVRLLKASVACRAPRPQGRLALSDPRAVRELRLFYAVIAITRGARRALAELVDPCGMRTTRGPILYSSLSVSSPICVCADRIFEVRGESTALQQRCSYGRIHQRRSGLRGSLVWRVVGRRLSATRCITLPSGSVLRSLSLTSRPKFRRNSKTSGVTRCTKMRC